jgi:hypothetical protein
LLSEADFCLFVRSQTGVEDRRHLQRTNSRNLPHADRLFR